MLSSGLYRKTCERFPTQFPKKVQLCEEDQQTPRVPNTCRLKIKQPGVEHISFFSRSQASLREHCDSGGLQKFTAMIHKILCYFWFLPIQLHLSLWWKTFSHGVRAFLRREGIHSSSCFSMDPPSFLNRKLKILILESVKFYEVRSTSLAIVVLCLNLSCWSFLYCHAWTKRFIINFWEHKESN